MLTRSTYTIFGVAVLVLTACGRQAAPALAGDRNSERFVTFSAPASPITNSVPILSHDEVLKRFRARSSATEIREFDRLVAANDSDSQTHALEIVLFKLTADELLQIGISQDGEAGHYQWAVAESTGFADGGHTFEQALARVGVQAGGIIELGIAGYFVPREQFFIARRALLSAGLRSNEITILEPKFTLR